MKKPSSSFNPVILLISMYFPPEIIGGATAAWNRAMIFHNIGYSVVILSGFPSYPTGKVKDEKYKGRYFYVEHVEPFTVIRIRLLPIAHVGLVKRLVLFFNFILISIVLMPKILHITGSIAITFARAPILFSSFIGFTYAKFTKSFFVLEVPDLWPEELVNIKTRLSFLFLKLGRFVAKLAYSLPDCMVTISDLAVLRITETYKPKIPVYGIPIGVDPSKFPMLSKTKSRQELIEKGIFPQELANKFIVLYSGLISVAQRVESLAYAAEMLKNEKDIAFVIIGEGEKKKTLEQLKKDLELHNLFLLPIQPRELVPTIISSTDICAITLSDEPIFEIALPTKFYEYLASKKPLLGICKGELANIINSNGIGRVASHGNISSIASAVKELRDSPNLLQTMINNSEKAIQSFSLEKIADDFSRIFQVEKIKLYDKAKSDLKVLVVTSWFPNKTRPNVAPFVFNFVKNLGESGATVSVIAPESEGEEAFTKREFMTVYRVSKQLPLLSMLRLAEKLKPDIIHVHAPNFFSSNAIITAKLKAIPIVATVHRAEIDRVGGIVSKLRKIALSRFNNIVAVSNYTKSLAINAGISEEMITVIYNSCNEAIFSNSDKAMARRKLQLPIDKKIILYVGNLVKEKGVDNLIESCKIINQKNQDFLVLIIGNGEDRNKLDSLVASYGLGDNIRFLNWQDPTRLPDYYNAADIFTLPSLTEGHSVALLEAMASGLPVVASMVGGNKETVEDGHNGFLFESGRPEILAAKLLTMLEDNNLRRQMSQRSTQIYIEKFSTKNQIEKYLKLYQSILNRTR